MSNLETLRDKHKNLRLELSVIASQIKEIKAQENLSFVNKYYKYSSSEHHTIYISVHSVVDEENVLVHQIQQSKREDEIYYYVRMNTLENVTYLTEEIPRMEFERIKSELRAFLNTML